MNKHSERIRREARLLSASRSRILAAAEEIDRLERECDQWQEAAGQQLVRAEGLEDENDRLQRVADDLQAELAEIDDDDRYGCGCRWKVDEEGNHTSQHYWCLEHKAMEIENKHLKKTLKGWEHIANAALTQAENLQSEIDDKNE
jgi:DNA mismatch repair ATPase MutS